MYKLVQVIDYQIFLPFKRLFDAEEQHLHQRNNSFQIYLVYKFLRDWRAKLPSARGASVKAAGGAPSKAKSAAPLPLSVGASTARAASPRFSTCNSAVRQVPEGTLSKKMWGSSMAVQSAPPSACPGSTHAVK